LIGTQQSCTSSPVMKSIEEPSLGCSRPDIAIERPAIKLDEFLARCQKIGESFWRNRIRSEPCCYCQVRYANRLIYRGAKVVDSLMTIEHVIPLSQGGIKGYTNYVGACRACNKQRGNLGLLVFLVSRGLNG
jgi:5-methylcytosine-specific restriction endonuclease McrA